MKTTLPNKLATLCFLTAATLPCLHAQEDLPADAIAPSTVPELIGPMIEGEAHENLANIEEFIQSRFTMMAMADPDRYYGPLGVIKDGEIEPPKIEDVTPPVDNTEEGPKTVATPAIDLLKSTVDALEITGFNSGGGSILLGVREISIGQPIPGSNDIFLSNVKPNQLTFKSKSSGKEYTRPVGFNPGGIQSRKDFLDSIEGVNRR